MDSSEKDDLKTPSEAHDIHDILASPFKAVQTGSASRTPHIAHGKVLELLTWSFRLAS